MNEIFNALLEEAAFTKDILASGVTQIGKANYAYKGIYFQAFTSLATGLERIGKLCLLLDYYIKNNGTFPSKAFMQRNIGHNLELLYSNSKSIINDHGINIFFNKNLEDELHRNIIEILSGFAKGDRYSNIDFLVTLSRESDPIFQWNKRVDEVLFEKRVTKAKRERIGYRAKVIDQIASEFMLVRHTSEERKDINSIYNASFLTGRTEAIAKYRQLYVLQIIRYWVEILKSLQYLAMDRSHEIPYFSEIFAIFFAEDKYFLTRKSYEKN